MSVRNEASQRSISVTFEEKKTKGIEMKKREYLVRQNQSGVISKETLTWQD